DDTLLGGLGADKLDGGDGVDLMYGGDGNDVYTVRDPADRAVETDPGTGLDSGGTDTVNASVSFTIEPFIETLKLTGTAAIAGTGNDAGNRIIGNSGANTLAGAGGQDTLTGGGSDDTFVLDAPTGTSADRITDFSASQGDRIGVHGSDCGLAAGTLDPDWFESGATATRPHAEFLYDAAARALLWDPDGAGAADATTIATFTTAVGLSHTDFVVL
ncbi:MAG: calcium-binding protein, partial [Rhodospirillaceae bacterium]|nr:calcium-binding protein [Rhodospirillaceae bacterium]